MCATFSLAQYTDESIRFGVTQCQNDYPQFLASRLSRERYNTFCQCYITQAIGGLTEEESAYQERYGLPSPEFTQYATSVREWCLAPRQGLTGSQLVEAHFRELVASVDEMDAQSILGMSNTIYSFWNIFSVKFNTVENYLKLSHNEKAVFLAQIATMIEKIGADEENGDAPEGSTVGGALMQMYFAALSHNDSPRLIEEIANFLEPYIGYDLQAPAAADEGE